MTKECVNMFSLLFGGLKKGSVSPSEAKKRLEEDKGVVLLDVRTPDEYRNVRIPGSKLVPVGQIHSKIEKVVPDKAAEIIVYCQSGMRASTASAQLESMGYTNVRNLGGIISWPYETESGR